MNLLPCLARTCKREDEAIQETLSVAMQKICPPLMGFATESEVKVSAIVNDFFSLYPAMVTQRGKLLYENLQKVVYLSIP